MKITLSSNLLSPKVIFKDTCLNIKSGEINFLIGANGSGKSTLVLLASQLKKPDFIKIENPNFSTKKELNLIKSKFRVLFQNPKIQLLNQSIKEELSFSNKNFNIEKIEELFREFNLDLDILDKKSFQLSVGEMKKILIIEFLISDAQILILDEIDVNLDLNSKHNLFLKLSQIAKKNSKYFLVITHDMNLVYEFGSNINFLEKGNISYYSIEEWNNNSNHSLEWISLKGKIRTQISKKNHFKILEDIFEAKNEF